MKEIITVNFKKLADMITHPPVPNESNESELSKKKKKKKIYQLNMVVDDIESE
jgi:hypothetical protein